MSATLACGKATHGNGASLSTVVTTISRVSKTRWNNAILIMTDVIDLKALVNTPASDDDVGHQSTVVVSNFASCGCKSNQTNCVICGFSFNLLNML